MGDRTGNAGERDEHVAGTSRGGFSSQVGNRLPQNQDGLEGYTVSLPAVTSSEVPGPGLGRVLPILVATA